MNQLTFKEAENLIFEAYFKDEILPFDNKYCFCGTLSPNESWASPIINGIFMPYPYTLDEYTSMEGALFRGMSEVIQDDRHQTMYHPKYEDAILLGMTYALNVLKDIHLKRGEVIDNSVNLKKRNLVKV